MSDAPPIQEALAAVMGAVRAVGKNDRNEAQRFNFRGVDAVVNAVGPALRDHGVIVSPDLVDYASDSYTTKNGAVMRSVTVHVRYTFTGPAGDQLVCSVLGEASDAGDKAVPKAMSVAFRTALLQALCLPTDEGDPDMESHERSGAPVSQRPSGPDWEALGWRAGDEHDAAKVAIRERAGALSDESKATLKAWAETTGYLKRPMSRDEMGEYERQVSALEAGDPSPTSP